MNVSFTFRPQWIQPAGPNKALVAGPQKGIKKGAAGTEKRVSLSQGNAVSRQNFILNKWREVA